MLRGIIICVEQEISEVGKTYVDISTICRDALWASTNYSTTMSFANIIMNKKWADNIRPYILYHVKYCVIDVTSRTVWVSSGHLCKAETPTEPKGENVPYKLVQIKHTRAQLVTLQKIKKSRHRRTLKLRYRFNEDDLFKPSQASEKANNASFRESFERTFLW